MAEAKSNEELGIVPPFYLPNGQEWMDRRNAIDISSEPLGVTSYPNGIILPLRNRSDVVTMNSAFEGGACDSEGVFVGGHERAEDPDCNYACSRGYAVEASELRQSDERVVFMGVLYPSFGHVLVDTTSRFWYLLDTSRTEGRKLAFALSPNCAKEKINRLFNTMLEALGNDARDVVIVSEPTRFAEVVVPDEGLAILRGAHKAMAEVFGRVRESVHPGRSKKIYLSRSKFYKQDCINESYLENFYRSKGFEIFYPETMKIEDQISIISGADEIATTVGTMSHLAVLFSKDDAHISIFERGDTVIGAQLVCDKLMNKQPFYIDSTRNLLPSAHASGIFLFGYTKYFQNYLDDLHIAYEEAELQMEGPSAEDYLRYLQKYEHRSHTRFNRVELRQYDMFDVLRSLEKGLTGALPVGAYSRRSSELIVEACSAKFEDAYLNLELAVPIEMTQGAISIIMVSRFVKCKQRRIEQELTHIGDGRISVKLNVNGFFQKLTRGVSDCNRWDFFLDSGICSTQLRVALGSRAFTDFSSAFFFEEGRLLVPHVSSENVMCLWHITGRRTDFSKEFFHERNGRPLVNDLLVRMVRAERWDVIPALYRDFAAGHITCIPFDDGTAWYRGHFYRVGREAYFEACLNYGSQKQVPHKPKWLTRR